MTIKPFILSALAFSPVLLGGVAPAALAAESNTYIGAHAGMNFVDDTTAKIDFGSGIVLDGNLDINNGSEFGIVIGQRFGGWRLEGEVQRGGFEVVQASLAGTNVASGAKGNYLTLMLNGYRNLKVTETTELFAGAGIGWGRMTYPNIAFDPSCNCFSKASKGGFAYQFRGGISQKLSSAVDVFAQYNHLFLPKTGAAGSPGISYAKTNFGVASLGMLVHFGGRKAAAAAAPAPAMAPVEAAAPAPAEPAPAPVAPTLPEPFLVYFDVDSANLTAQGVETLDQAAAAFQQFQNVQIALVGGTDTTAGKAYNLRLSQKRLDAVTAYLQAKGVAAEALVAKAVGETELRVATGDNTPEPGNRRVEVSIQEKAQ